MTDNDKSLWLRVKVPVPPGTKGVCDICHTLKSSLDLIGGPGDRTYTCLDCMDEGRIWLFGTPEGRDKIRALHKKKEITEEHEHGELEQGKKS